MQDAFFNDNDGAPTTLSFLPTPGGGQLTIVVPLR
jgi:hypothetical protein